MEIHSMRIEHAVQNNAMSYAQRQQQNHRPNNHAQNAADIYKPSRSPVSSAGRYPYPTTTQLHQSAPGLAQRYPQQATAAAAYSGPTTAYREYRQPRISLLHPPEYGRGRQEAAMLPGGQGGGQVSVVHLDDGMGGQQHQPLKKIRLQDHKDNVQPLRIDTREQPGTYNPQVEAISPTLPESVQEDQPHKPTKDDIILKIARTDREIARAESQISILKKKQQELEELALKPQVKNEVEEDTQPKHNSLPQKIYAENRKRAASAHAQLDSLGPKVEWPLYNQPTDSTIYHENKRKNKLFKRRLLEYFKKKHAEKETRNTYLTETYSKLMQEWIRKVDKIESSTKRKAKEAKNREFFEKVFPELRKQREDKERFNRVGARVKSEADMEEIMDNLQEQAMEDKKMRSYAVIPPILLDKREKEVQYNNNNGFVEDMETMYKNRQYINMWTPHEKEIFKEKYLQHPKNFVVISSYLDRKSVADCVHYYYTSKKTENYKQLLRKSRQRTRASKNTQKVNNAANSSVVDILTTGVTTRLQREQQQKTVVREASQNQESSTTTASSIPFSQTSTTISTSPASSQATSSSTSVTSATGTTSSATASTTNSPSPLNAAPTTSVISCSTPSVATSSSPPASSMTTSSANGAGTTSAVKQEPASASPLAASAGPPEKFTDFNSFEEYNNQINKGATGQGGAYFGDDPTKGGNVEGQITDVKVEVKKENESATEAVSDQNANAVMENKKKKERRKDKDTDAMETSEDDSLEVPEINVQGVCVVCNAQLGIHLHSRPLPTNQASQYGLREDQVPQNARVCNTCRCKVVRSRYTHCPLPNCPNPRGRVKRLRSFPQRLQELPQDLKETLLAEFNIPTGVTKCCSACFNRIQRRLGPVEEWPEEEINKLKVALTELGANWQALGEKLGRTPNQIRGFYSMNRKRLNLESCLGDRKPTLTDEEESGSSTSSCEDQPVTTLRSTTVTERERHSSDTASAAESPPALAGSNQNPIKKEDYDSSATETADEAQTPDHYQGSATITPVVPEGQPRQNASPLSVKDLVLNVIEFSLMKNPGNQQQNQNPPTSGITPTISSILEQDLNDVTIVSEYSLNSQQQQSVVQQRQVRNDMNIAKLVTPLIGATITPVTGPIPPQQPPEQVPTGRNDLVVLQVPDTNREPETLDLSIKKPREFHQPTTIHKQATPQQMHRQDPSPQPQYMYHQERKSPAFVRTGKQGSPKLGNPNPKAGSITLGTPIITQPRYDGLLRQMPPDPKMGSITQGTPIHIPHMSADKRVYEIYKKIGSGPQASQVAQNVAQPPPQQPQGFPAQYRHQPYNVEQQLSSRQIINDYITSQQMLGRRNEKTQYYQPGAMHRTPPPPQNQQQRQGVIQRHTRPPYLPPGHEALSSLVDVAVQQPSLPVPVTPPHEGLGKTMADNIRDQPHRFQIIQHQQNVRQQQQRLDEQRRAYHQQQVQQQHQQQQHQQQQQQQQQQQMPQSRQQVPRSDSSTLTAASLIDAIITHQINQTAEGGREVMQNTREPPRAGDILFQSFHRNPPSQVQETMDNRPPSVINVDLDSDGINKNLTVKELTDSVISHDYGARQPPPGSYYHMSQESVNEQWKRRLQQQQKENEKRSVTPQHDERQIIRIAQPQKYHVEPVSPPENNHWNEQTYRRFQQQPQSHMSPLDYVKNRIVEVMRTEDDKKENQENHPVEKDRSDSPGDMVIDEEKNEVDYQSSTSQHQQQPSAYSTYPFVHKDMSVNDSGRRSNEPKPLLSAQYEPLSDED